MCVCVSACVYAMFAGVCEGYKGALDFHSAKAVCDLNH